MTTEKGGLPYLGGKRWLDITRDERFFCAELYFALKQPEALKRFIERINEALGEDNKAKHLDPNAQWEVGYEVALHRDFVNALGYKGETSIKKLKQFSQKRTFDLCLFGQDKLVIIEAKAYLGLKGKQLEEFEKDAKLVEELTGLSHNNVILIGLWSSRYSDKAKNNTSSRVKSFHEKVNHIFDGIIHWNDLGIAGPPFNEKQDLFEAAEATFGRLAGGVMIK